MKSHARVPRTEERKRERLDSPLAGCPVELELTDADEDENDPEPAPPHARAGAKHERDEDEKRDQHAGGKNEIMPDRLALKRESVQHLERLRQRLYVRAGNAASLSHRLDDHIRQHPAIGELELVCEVRLFLSLASPRLKEAHLRAD